jgi:hypothetical protein
MVVMAARRLVPELGIVAGKRAFANATKDMLRAATR